MCEMFAAVTFICDHPDIRAISFVGSDRAVRLTDYLFPWLHPFVDAVL